MLSLLFSLFLQSDTLAHQRTMPNDSIRTDTLREVVVRPDSVLPVVKAIDESLKRHPVPKVKTLGDVLEQLSPGLNDKITHPFAFKQRQKERRHKRLMRALDDFDRVDTFEDQLRAAYERQMVEDSLAAIKSLTEKE